MKNKSGRLTKATRVYLIKVEQKQEGKFVSTIFAHSLRLKWSSQPAAEADKPVDLPRDLSQYADVISTDQGSPDNFRMHTTLFPFYCAHLFDNAPKTLRLTVLVTGDDVKTDTTRFVFEWKGGWDTFEAYNGYSVANRMIALV